MAKLMTEKGSGSLHLKVLLEGEVFLAEELYFAIWWMGECWSDGEGRVVRMGVVRVRVVTLRAEERW